MDRNTLHLNNPCDNEKTAFSWMDMNTFEMMEDSTHLHIGTTEYIP